MTDLSKPENEATQRFVEMLRLHWSFNDRQEHTWHTREDFIERVLGDQLELYLKRNGVPQGFVSVELLQVERATSDRLREENARLRSLAQGQFSREALRDIIAKHQKCSMPCACLRNTQRSDCASLADDIIVATISAPADSDSQNNAESGPSETTAVAGAGTQPLPPQDSDAVHIQARKASGDEWTDIYPAQLKGMTKLGYEVRAFYTSDIPIHSQEENAGRDFTHQRELDALNAACSRSDAEVMRLTALVERAMCWEDANDAEIDVEAYYVVQHNGHEWRDFDLAVLSGRLVLHHLEPHYVRGRPEWVAKINRPFSSDER